MWQEGYRHLRIGLRGAWGLEILEKEKEKQIKKQKTHQKKKRALC